MLNTTKITKELVSVPDCLWDIGNMYRYMSARQNLRHFGTVTPGYLILDTIVKLSGRIGVTQKTMTFDTHVCLILLQTLNPLELWGTHKKQWAFQPRPFADVIGLVRCSYRYKATLLLKCRNLSCLIFLARQFTMHLSRQQGWLACYSLVCCLARFKRWRCVCSPWYGGPQADRYKWSYIYIWWRPPASQSPPPRMGWVQNLRFSYIFMEPRQNTWYLHCFDKLGLRNRGICSVL